VALGTVVQFTAGAREFSNLQNLQIGSEDHPDTAVQGTFTPGLKRLGLQTDHSPPLGA